MTFPEASVNTHVLCYHFANDLDENKFYRVDDITMSVVDVTGVSPAEGYNHEPASQLRVHWILADELQSGGLADLDAGERSDGDDSRERDPLQPGVARDTKFDMHGRYYLTYRFGQELPKSYPAITVYSLDVLSIKNPKGIVGCLYRPEMDIDYFRYMNASDKFDSVSFKAEGGSCVKVEDALPIDGRERVW